MENRNTNSNKNQTTNSIFDLNLEFSTFRKFDKDTMKRELDRSGIYVLFDKDLKPLYMGRSTCLKNRLTAYMYKRADNKKTIKKIELCKKTKYYKVFYCSKEDAENLEITYRKDFEYNTY